VTIHFLDDHRDQVSFRAKPKALATSNGGGGGGGGADGIRGGGVSGGVSFGVASHVVAPSVYEHECVVCFGAPSECLVLPCAHLVLCRGCAADKYTVGNAAAEKACPVCLEPIDKIVHI